MEDKLQKALQIINQNEFTGIKDLVSALGITRVTAYRYLQRLEERCLIKRIRGGILNLNRDFSFCPEYYYSVNDKYFHERILVAKKAVEMISENDCVFIGGGQNTLHLARELKLCRKKTTVVTNSLPVALLLSGVCQVNITGIMSTTNEGILIGNPSEDIFVNKAFVAPGSVSEDGFYNSTPLIVQLESTFLQKAKKTVMLINTETYLKHCSCKMCSLEEVDIIIAAGEAPSFIHRQNSNVCCVA